MICSHCGGTLPDGAAFCFHCGTSLAEDVVNANEEVATEVENAADAMQDSMADAYAEATGSTNTPKVPKNKTGLAKFIGAHKVAVIASVISVAMVAIVAFNFKAIANTCAKIFMSDTGYTQHVLKDAVHGAADSFTEVYEAVEEFSINDIKLTSGATIELSEDAIDMIDDAVGGYDLDFLKKNNIEASIARKDGMIQLIAGYKCNDSAIVTIEVLFDADEGVVYFRIPEVNPEYASIDIASMDNYSYERAMDELDMVFEMYEELKEQLPDSSKIEKCITNALIAAINAIDDAEQGSEIIKADGISKKVTTLTIKIDDELVSNMACAFIDSLLNDKNFEEVVNSIEDIVGVDDLYDYVEEGLEEVLDEAEDIEFDGKANLVIYVDGEGEICGLSAEVKGLAKVETVFLEKGGKFGTETSVKVGGEKLFSLEGHGKYASEEMTGDFVLKAGDVKFKFSLENFRIDAAKGIYKGTVVVKMADVIDFIDDMGANVYRDYSYEDYGFYDYFDDAAIARRGGAALAGELVEELEDFSIAFSFDLSDKKQAYGIAIKDGKKMFARADYKSETTKAGTIKTPSDSVDIADEEDAKDYFYDCNLDGVIKGLEKAGFPDELIEELEDLDF